MKYFIFFLKVLFYIPAAVVIWFFAAIVIFILSFKFTGESFFQDKAFNLSKIVNL